MTAIRRILTLIVLTAAAAAAVVAGASVPAWAAYGDSATVSTTTYATSTSNVQSYASTTAAGPGADETTTTTITRNTMLSVTAPWPASPSRGVSGYLVNAHLVDGSSFPMAQTAPGTHFTSQTVDADNLAYQPRLSVTTLTSYGWTAQSAISGYISC